jgi:hypothetical protein
MTFIPGTLRNKDKLAFFRLLSSFWRKLHGISASENSCSPPSIIIMRLLLVVVRDDVLKLYSQQYEGCPKLLVMEDRKRMLDIPAPERPRLGTA